MTELNYGYVDFLWEVTRRNELYRSDFQRLRKLILKKTGPEQLEKKIRSFQERWNIFHRGWSFLTNWEKALPHLEWLDPKVTIDQIKDAIKSGGKEEYIHPFIHLELNRLDTVAPVYYNDDIRTKSIVAYYDSIVDVDFSRMFVSFRSTNLMNPNYLKNGWCRMAEQVEDVEYFDLGSIDCFADKHLAQEYLVVRYPLVKDRIVVSIDLRAKDEDIMEEIKRVKYQVYKALEKSRIPVFRPKLVKRYLSWLKKYDDIVDFIRDKLKAKLEYREGVIVLPGPDIFSFSKMASNDLSGPKFAAEVQGYRRAFEGAVRFIQATPNIVAAPDRVEKRKDAPLLKELWFTPEDLEPPNRKKTLCKEGISPTMKPYRQEE